MAKKETSVNSGSLEGMSDAQLQQELQRRQEAAQAEKLTKATAKAEKLNASIQEQETIISEAQAKIKELKSQQRVILKDAGVKTKSGKPAAPVSPEVKSRVLNVVQGLGSKGKEFQTKEVVGAFMVAHPEVKENYAKQAISRALVTLAQENHVKSEKKGHYTLVGASA